jgi:hypothetical protein
MELTEYLLWVEIKRSLRSENASHHLLYSGSDPDRASALEENFISICFEKNIFVGFICVLPGPWRGRSTLAASHLRDALSPSRGVKRVHSERWNSGVQ